MAKYGTTKFYWLQVKEDFFDEDTISWLEEQPNGKEYSLFYLKLCLKSLRTNGILIREVGEMLIPYDYVKLAKFTQTSKDTVIVAIKLLEKIGLVKVLDNGELFLTQLEGMIGCQSKSAFKKQQRFISLENRGVDKCPPKCSPELELDKELDINNNILCDDEKNSNQKIVNSNVLEIFNYWNDKKIIVHKNLSDDIIKKIENALKKYSKEEIKLCIDRYNYILKDEKYFFKYKWNLKQFLSQKNGISDFTDEGTKYLSYINSKEGKQNIERECANQISLDNFGIEKVF